MMWVRLDTHAPHHRKLVRAGSEAFALWVAGLCYCNAHGTDGKIEKDMVCTLYVPLSSRAAKVAARLVDVGLWYDRGDHYEVHDYEKYQGDALKEEVEARREYERTRKREQRAEQKRARVPDNVPDKRGTDNGTASGTKPGLSPCAGAPASGPAVPTGPTEVAAAAADSETDEDPEPPELARETGIVDRRIEPEDVSRAWHKALTQPNGGDLLTLHHVRDWRGEYATIATVLNRLPPEARWIALDAVCRWFWLASDGPVQAGRLDKSTAEPKHLSRRIGSDLKRANEWYAAQQHEHPTHGAMAS